MLEKLEYGMVGLNQGMVSNPAAPFGGIKHSASAARAATRESRSTSRRSTAPSRPEGRERPASLPALSLHGVLSPVPTARTAPEPVDALVSSPAGGRAGRWRWTDHPMRPEVEPRLGSCGSSSVWNSITVPARPLDRRPQGSARTRRAHWAGDSHGPNGTSKLRSVTSRFRTRRQFQLHMEPAVVVRRSGRARSRAACVVGQS